MSQSDTARCAEDRLKQVGLRVTKQRIALGALLLDGRHRHVSAESFHEEAGAHGICVSLATIYNTLHQFTGAGLLRQVVVDGARSYFDTNTSTHHHFYVASEDRLVDMEPGRVRILDLPDAPKGTTIDRVDVVVRVKSLTPTDGTDD